MARTREHELETLSRRDFENRIPSGWVVRAADAEADYGIDRRVEIFEGGEATGLEFYAQLKATDAELPRALTVSLPVRFRDYYRSLALPVLMVRFHAPSGRSFAKWFHAYDPHYAGGAAREDAKTFSFRWVESDEWGSETPEHLKAQVAAFRRFRDARIDAPVAFHVEAAAGAVSAAEALIVLREQAEGLSRVLAFEPGPAAPGQAALSFDRDRLVANLAGVVSVSLHRSLVGPEMTTELAADALVTTGLVLVQVGRPAAAAEVFSLAGPSAPSLLLPEVVRGAYVAFVASGRILEALRLARAVGERDSDEADVAQATLGMAGLGPGISEEAREEYRTLVRTRAERRMTRGGTSAIAAAADFYSIGNSFRSSGRPVEALRAYIQAARLDPTYRERAYWNAEVGGMLYMTDHFVLSARFYERAVDIEPDPWTRGLHGDALMYAGFYGEAEKVFAAVVDESAEWALRAQVLPRIRSMAAVDVQSRQREAARAATTAAITGSNAPLEEIRQGLVTAIRLDALTEDAWYLLAVILFDDEPEEAAEIMLLAAIIRRYDASSWALAFGLEWATKRREERLQQIASTAFRLAGAEFRAQILAWARHESRIDDRDEVMRVLAASDALRTEDERRFQGFTLRMPSEEGVQEFTVEFPEAR